MNFKRLGECLFAVLLIIIASRNYTTFTIEGGLDSFAMSIFGWIIASLFIYKIVGDIK